jgi:hypothetical protein
MNLGQTLLTLGMFVLLITSVISANRMILQNAESNLKTEAMTGAATVARNLMQEAMSKAFDEKANRSGKQDTSAFTPSRSLGPTSLERSQVPIPDSSFVDEFKSKTDFDDFDDYDGYKRIALENNISGFVAEAVVFYVEPWDPDTPTSKRTYYKVIKVKVSHPLYLDVPIEFSSLLSY